MKRIIALTLVTLGLTVSARAQWVVFDPTAQMQSIMNTAQEIAQFVKVIQNQVQQIQTLNDQLNEFKHYESLFGDPKTMRFFFSTPAEVGSRIGQWVTGGTIWYHLGVTLLEAALASPGDGIIQGLAPAHGLVLTAVTYPE